MKTPAYLIPVSRFDILNSIYCADNAIRYSELMESLFDTSNPPAAMQEDFIKSLDFLIGIGFVTFDGDSYGWETDFSLSPQGREAYFDWAGAEAERKSYNRRVNIRYWITTAIAVGGLVVALIALLAT